MGGREIDRATRKVLRRRSELTSLAQPFNDGPFGSGEPDGAGHRIKAMKHRLLSPSASLSSVTGVRRIGQHNRLHGPAVRFGHTGRGQHHYRSFRVFGKMLRHCALNATESQ